VELVELQPEGSDKISLAVVHPLKIASAILAGKPLGIWFFTVSITSGVLSRSLPRYRS
jgi:hypothetical protein